MNVLVRVDKMDGELLDWAIIAFSEMPVQNPCEERKSELLQELCARYLKEGRFLDVTKLRPHDKLKEKLELVAQHASSQAYLKVSVDMRVLSRQHALKARIGETVEIPSSVLVEICEPSSDDPSHAWMHLQ